MRRALTERAAVWIALASGLALGAAGQELPAGYWTVEEARAVLDRTLEVRVEPDLSALSAAEGAAVEKLLVAGEILQRLYERQRHPEAIAASEALEALHFELGEPAATRDLLELYWVFNGPIATTLDNRREAFLPVEPERPGKNVYPLDAERAELDAVSAEASASRAALLDLRAVVRRDSEANRAADRAVLARHPALALLHPEFAAAVAAPAAAGAFYAAPYAVAYADDLVEVYSLLRAAAGDLADEDPELARYLRHRGRDLLAGDYEAGDASWVSGRFGNLNAQIGSYETYDDALFGVKAFYGMSVLLRDEARSAALAAALGGIQNLEDSLPYDRHKKVREELPVGVYNVIADFGQARGTNTATILPNEAEHARKYGRTILLRYNILTHPELFELARQRFTAALAPRFHADLTLEAGFERTLWHEIGHYLGVDRAADGRSLGEALAGSSDLLEEMKADLVSLYSARALHESGYHDAGALRGIYASGVLRVLQSVEPRRAQPYQTMQLMQWNYFLEKGLLSFDPQTVTLGIDYAKYHEVVTELLREVLAVQAAGDPARAEAFVERYFVWDEALHEPIAEKIRAAAAYRFRRVVYAALE
jgi:hypothetical protein